MADVAIYLQVSHQRVAQMRQVGTSRKPDQVDGIDPLWKPERIGRSAEREWWDTPTLAEATRESEKPPEPEGPSDFSRTKLALEVLPVN